MGQSHSVPPVRLSEAGATDQNTYDNRVLYMSVGQLKELLVDVGIAPSQKEEILRMAKQAVGATSPAPQKRWRLVSSASTSSTTGAPLRIIGKRSTSSAYRSDTDKRSPRSRYFESEHARSDICSDIDDVIYLSEAEHESMSAYSAWTSASHRQPQRTLEQVMPGHWKIGYKIGTGSFGEVYTGINTSNGQLIAVKCLPLIGMEREMTALQREIEVMRSLKHPNVVQYLGAEIQQAEHRLLIFQEWVPGGSIQTLLHQYGPFEPGVVREYSRQILHGLVYLHNKHIIHRDIKGGNILVDERGIVKLADFGACKRLGDDGEKTSRSHTTKGSPYFMAPEVLMKQKYGRKADVWSFGGAVLQMATGKPPWYEVKAKTYLALTNHIAQHEGPPTIPESVSPQLRAFLLRCFERNPSKRPRAIELLNDPYLQETTKSPRVVLDPDLELEPLHSPVPLEKLIERLWTKSDGSNRGKPRTRRWFNFRRNSDRSNSATPRGNANDAFSPRDSASEAPDDDAHEVKSRERLSSADSNSVPGSPVGALSSLSSNPELESYLQQRRHNRLRTLTGHGSVRLNLGVEPPSPTEAQEPDDPSPKSQETTPLAGGAGSVLAIRSLEDTDDSGDSLSETVTPAGVNMDGWPEWAKKRYLDKQKQAAKRTSPTEESQPQLADAAAMPAAVAVKRASEKRPSGLTIPDPLPAPVMLEHGQVTSRNSMSQTAAEPAKQSMQVKTPPAIVTTAAPTPAPAEHSKPSSSNDGGSEGEKTATPRHETLEEYRKKRERKKRELQRQQKMLEQRSLPSHSHHQPGSASADMVAVVAAAAAAAASKEVATAVNDIPPADSSSKPRPDQLPPIVISDDHESDDKALALLAEQVRSSTTTPVRAHVDYPSPFGTLRNSRNFERIPSGVLLHASSMNKRAMSHGSAENIWRAHQQAILVDIQPVLSSAEEKAMQEEASRSQEHNEKIRRNRHRSVSWSIRMYKRLQTITDSSAPSDIDSLDFIQEASVGSNTSNPFGRCHSVGATSGKGFGRGATVHEPKSQVLVESITKDTK